MSTTRSKSKSLEKDISSSIKDEVSKFMLSESFKSIVQSAVTEAVKSFLAQQLEPLQNEINLLKATVSNLHEELGNVRRVVHPLEEKVCMLENKIVDMKCELSRVSVKANDNEQYSRRYNIRIFGCNEEQGENCSEKVVELCKNNLDLNDFTVDNIDRCHRVGNPRVGGKPRAIIVRLKSYEAKRSIMQAKRKLKGSSFFINEDLTRLNQNLYSTARKDCINVSSVWSLDGKVFAKRQRDDKIFHIVNHEDLSKFDLV